MSARHEYVVVYEFTGRNWSAFCPDVPGCVAAGESLEETRELMRNGLKLHLDALAADGRPAPEPTAKAFSEGIQT